MAARIFDDPGFDVRPAGQPLIFSIDDTGTTPDRFVVIVKRSSLYTGGSPVQVAKFYLTPNTEGVAFFDLSPIAESILEFPLKAGSTVVHKTATLADAMDGLTMQRFQVQVAQYDNSTGEGSVDDTEEVIVTNGTQQIADGLHPSFNDYLWGNDVGFLTERPVVNNVITHRARRDEELVVSFIDGDDIGEARAGTYQLRDNLRPLYRVFLRWYCRCTFDRNGRHRDASTNSNWRSKTKKPTTPPFLSPWKRPTTLIFTCTAPTRETKDKLATPTA